VEYYVFVHNGLLHVLVLCFRIQERIGCRDAALDVCEVSSFCLLCVMQVILRYRIGSIVRYYECLVMYAAQLHFV